MATGSLVDEQILGQFHALSRKPFRIRLAVLHGIPLNAEKLEVWANRFPDKLAQAEAIYARLSGYSDKLEVEIHGTLAHKLAELQGLSDAQLEALDRQRQAERLALGSGVTLSPATPAGKGPISITPPGATLAKDLT